MGSFPPGIHFSLTHSANTGGKLKHKQEHAVFYLSCLLEGGACVITDVGDGNVGWRASLLKCRGREPGRTIVGVGAELATGFERISWEKNTIGWHFTWRDRNNLKKALKKVLTLESLLSSDMLDEESGLSGGEESTCNGPSFSILTSDGVCKGGALNREYWKTIHNLI